MKNTRKQIGGQEDMKLTKDMTARSVAYNGSAERITGLMKRAGAGEELTLCFLGGSITQGSLSSKPQTCYAYLIYKWFSDKFPKASFKYVNAGIGGTTSQFGVARLTENVSPCRPDFCMLEFSVNDASNPYFCESFEAVVRRIMSSASKPAMIIMNNLFYDTGENAQEEHNRIGEAYDIPCISVRDALYPEIVSGRLVRTEVSPDGLHPNDAGHAILAELVINYLEKLYDRYIAAEKPEAAAAPVVTLEPVTKNALEHLHRTQNRSKAVECKGFKADHTRKKGIWDLFRNGWTASKKGDSISFSFAGSELAVQYLKTINRPAPIAEAIIDGDEKHPVRLDANFDENWGNHIHIDTLLWHGRRIDPQVVHHGTVKNQQPSREDLVLEAEATCISELVPKKKEHTVEIRIIEAHEDDRTAFYLVSFITA